MGTLRSSDGVAFDVPPGHIPIFSAGCEWVQFTATAQQLKTDEAIRRNTAAAPGTGNRPTQQA